MNQKQFIAAWRACTTEAALCQRQAFLTTYPGEIRVRIPSMGREFCPITWVCYCQGEGDHFVPGIAAERLMLDDNLLEDIAYAANHDLSWSHEENTYRLRRALAAYTLKQAR